MLVGEVAYRSKPMWHCEASMDGDKECPPLKRTDPSLRIISDEDFSRVQQRLSHKNTTSAGR